MARAGLTPITNCAAARLAREAAGTILAQHAADRAHRSTASAALLERLEAIEDACTYERAKSPLGAFFQMLLLHGDLEDDMAWVADRIGVDRQMRRMRRLAVSVLDQIEPGVDGETAAALRSYYLERRNDEWTALERALEPRPVH